MNVHVNHAPGPLERKDDGGRRDDKSPSELKKAFEDFGKAFAEFKTANDERLKEIEKIGAADVLTEEKTNRINAVLDKFEDVSQKATLAEKSQKALDELKEQIDQLETAFKRTGAGSETEKKDRSEFWARAVVNAHTQGVANLGEEERKALAEIQAEYKALSITPDTAGGYLAPTEFVREITKGVTEISAFRSLVRVRQTANKSVQIPKRTGQFAAQRVAEQGTKTETTGLTYGLDEFPLPEIYALVDISNQMLEDSAFNMEEEIRMEAMEQFDVKEGAEFVSGTGVNQAEGILSTSAGVSTTNSGAATAITADGLITLKHAIKTAYTRNANWIMNRTTLGSARKLKDGNGQYLWQPGLAMGKPNTLDGDPYVEMPDMPNEGAGNKPVAYGDFRRAYTWIDRIVMEMLRDPYTQATSGNVRFIIRKRSGGGVVLAEAIRALVCSA